jgi:hypothetical protein
MGKSFMEQLAMLSQEEQAAVLSSIDPELLQFLQKAMIGIFGLYLQVVVLVKQDLRLNG